LPSKPHALPSTRTFDVLVLGPQIAGAVAGALLARRGYRVAAVEHAPLATGYVEGDYRLPLGPTVVPHLRHLPSAQAVFEELGMGPEVTRACHPLGTIQLLSERARLDLFADGARRRADIQREFGSQANDIADAIDRLIAREEANAPFFAGQLPLPASGIAERFRLRGATRGLQIGDASELVSPGNHPLAQGLKELWRLSNHLAEQESLPEPNVVKEPARAALRPLAQWLRGLSHLEGGEVGLAALLRKRIEAAGGTVLAGQDAVVDELQIQQGRIVALKLLNSPNQYRARMVVAALDSASLRDLIPASARQRRQTQALDAVRIRSQLLTLNLVVQADGLPAGLADAAVGLPGGRSRSFFLQISPAERAAGGAHAHEKLLTLAMQVPPQSLSAGEDAVRLLLRELRDGAELFLPFLARHILLESSPQISGHDPSGHQRRQHPRLEIARPRQLGVTGLGPRSVLKNVILANQEVLPGLGLEGQFLAGLSAASSVQRLARKADPLAHQ
jgi:glycine/D-amino acid oxidase-like deaminating enzyme